MSSTETDALGNSHQGMQHHQFALEAHVTHVCAALLLSLDVLHMMAVVCVGYARRGLRSAIQSAVKDGLTVEEVMNPEADTFGSNAAHGAGAAAAAAAGKDWSQLSEELRAIDTAWSESKGGRASEFHGHMHEAHNGACGGSCCACRLSGKNLA